MRFISRDFLVVVSSQLHSVLSEVVDNSEILDELSNSLVTGVIWPIGRIQVEKVFRDVKKLERQMSAFRGSQLREFCAGVDWDKRYKWGGFKPFRHWL